MAISPNQEKLFKKQLEKVKKDSLLNQISATQASESLSRNQNQTQEAKKNYDPNKWKENIRNNNASKKEQAKQVANQGAAAAKALGASVKKRDVGIIGGVLFFMLIIFATIVDILPFITGGFSTIADWIIDIIFFIAVYFVLLITTGDIIGSFVGRKSVINLTQSILEFVPVIDLIPFHILATVIIYLDVKYDILALSKKLKQQST